MNPIILVYTEGLFRPLLNLLVGTTNIIPAHSVGWAIIVVTFIVRLILLPSSLHQVKRASQQQTKMAAVQGRLKHIKEQHKDDKAKQAEETMRLYRESGINPAAGCLPLLVQLPILIALYRVFLAGLTPEIQSMLYSFVPFPGDIHNLFFGINLTQPSLVLGILAGVAQFAQMKFLAPTPPQMTADDDAAAVTNSMQKNMAYIFPAMTVFISLRLPAALALYWFVTTVFGAAQQYLLRRWYHVSGNVPMV
ncbi:MAG: membrane protein insertase YidC [Candidatus Andersenbacteria bacterium]|nr:membrane protein insertase YidC [Candidatus Andersenbacteria bacterium]MBI3250759.1 membrane protein insertase YidC [Candidatus Andersenbacteria bacterium]